MAGCLEAGEGEIGRTAHKMGEAEIARRNAEGSGPAAYKREGAATANGVVAPSSAAVRAATFADAERRGILAWLMKSQRQTLWLTLYMAEVDRALWSGFGWDAWVEHVTLNELGVK